MKIEWVVVARTGSLFIFGTQSPFGRHTHNASRDTTLN